jgi:hypothetical protein
LLLAQNANVEQLYGTWRLVSYTREVVGTGERANIFGNAPHGFLTYGLDGRMSAIIVGDNRPKPLDLAKLTDQERAELFKTVVAYAGTYKVEGSQVVHNVDISWNKHMTGTAQTRNFWLEGRGLIISAGPQIGSDGSEIIAVFTWERVE